MSTPFWTSEPGVLLDKKHIGEIWPKEGMTSAEKLNAISRLVVLLSIVGFAVSRSVNVLITAAITLGVIVLLHTVRKSGAHGKAAKTVREAFANPKAYSEASHMFQPPTSNNPVMNVLPTQIMEDPLRKPAAPAFNPEVEVAINKYAQDNAVIGLADGDPAAAADLDKRLFQDLGDQFQFDQSMRPFYATASTQIPNDQGAFANFCYGDMISCKENNAVACIRNNARYTNP